MAKICTSISKVLTKKKLNSKNAVSRNPHVYEQNKAEEKSLSDRKSDFYTVCIFKYTNEQLREQVWQTMGHFNAH